MVIKKIFGVFTQLFLLPISFLQTALFCAPIYMAYLAFTDSSELELTQGSVIVIPIMFIICWGLALLVNVIFYKIKKQKLHKTVYYENLKGYYTTKTTTTHDVYINGEKAGSFDTTDTDISYDDGMRTEDTGMMIIAKITIPVALVLRLIGFVLSIVALFVDDMYSSVSIPKKAKERGYYVVPHCLFDICILKRAKS